MSYVPCKKNDSNGYILYVSLVSQADTKVMQANPTLAAGDVKIAVDDAAPGNLGTLPVVDADFTKRVKVTLSQAETNGDNLTIVFSDAAGAEWCDLTINIQTSAQTLDTIGTNVAAIEAKTNLIGASVALEAGGNLATAVADIAAVHVHVGTIDGHITADYATTEKNAIDLLDDANGLVNIHDTVDLVKAQTDLIPADITAQLDTNVPAIKAKTDLLPADTATQLDTNIPAIKAKTDLIPADIATQIDTNIPAILADTGTDGVVIPQAQADKVWGTAIRALTDKAGFTISGTKTTLDALNDISATQVATEADEALADYAPALETTAQDIKAQTDKFLFDVSNFVKSIAQNSELAHLDVDISSRETPAHVTAIAALLAAEIDDLITRAKGLNEIYDSVALRALEATLTAIKGAGWTDETLKAIKEAIGSGGIDAQAVRDAMKLAPSAGAPAAESIDKHLDDLVSGAEPPPKESFKI